jgi:hypothetical protein
MVILYLSITLKEPSSLINNHDLYSMEESKMSHLRKTTRNRFRPAAGQVLIGVVAAIAMIVVGIVASLLFLFDAGLALFYEDQLIAVASQVAANTTDPDKAKSLATDLFGSLGIQSNGLSVTVNNDSSISISNSFSLLPSATNLLGGTINLTGTSAALPSGADSGSVSSPAVLAILSRHLGPLASTDILATPIPPQNYCNNISHVLMVYAQHKGRLRAAVFPQLVAAPQGPPPHNGAATYLFRPPGDAP